MNIYEEMEKLYIVLDKANVVANGIFNKITEESRNGNFIKGTERLDLAEKLKQVWNAFRTGDEEDQTYADEIFK